MRTIVNRAAAAAFAFAATAGVLAAPTPAAAAEVGCNSFTSVHYAGNLYRHVPSVGSGSWNFDCVLARGANNVGVLALQESLNVCYGQSLATDSDFGPLTEQGVRNAQNILNWEDGAGLAVDGRFGPKTSSWFRFQVYDHANGGAPQKWCARR
ncbi:peptidoglycan-binding domain-containing protein [Catenuloplanes japonicus]|uniref:peptidoglycan-binding domain-containing protein n=1 Tax=Catenuloplanes japonicus TaxID=33876 RepID=UPI00052701E5|nr:peptidoglycan-binding domain-containing protein [Catenuloplanes japonicus]